MEVRSWGDWLGAVAVVEVREDGDLELVHSNGGREGHGDFWYIMNIE